MAVPITPEIPPEPYEVPAKAEERDEAVGPAPPPDAKVAPELGGKLAGLSLPRQVAVLAVWPFFELLLNSLVGVVDTVLAGRIDAASLDAIGAGAYVQWLLGMLHMTVGIGAGALIARAVGADRQQEANAGLGQALFLAAVWGAVTALAVALAARPIASIFLPDGEALDLAVVYLRWVSAGAAVGAVMIVGNACLRAAGDTRTPFLTMIVVNVVNTGASILFTFGPAPLGGRGVAGIAMGTAVAWVVGSLIVITVLLSGKMPVTFAPAQLRPRWALNRRIIRVGLPSLVESSGMWVGNACVGVIVKHLAERQGVGGLMGAHIIAIRVESLSFLPGVAVGTAAATLMGQYLGLGDPERAARATRLCWAVAASIMTVMGLAFLLVPQFFAGILASGAGEDIERVRHLAEPLIRICGPIQLFFGTYLVLSQALRGAGDTRGPMMITYASTFLVRLPAAYLLGVTLGLGLTGIWLGLCGELVVRGCLYVWRFNSGRWRTIEV